MSAHRGALRARPIGIALVTALASCELVAGIEQVDRRSTRSDEPADAAPRTGATTDPEGDPTRPAEPESAPTPEAPPAAEPEPSDPAGDETKGKPKKKDDAKDDAKDAEADADAARDEAAACTAPDFAAADRRALLASRTVSFPAPGLAYAPRCMRIQAGQSVTFSGPFSAFPIAPADTDEKNPITPVSKGTVAVFRFKRKGVYRYGSPGHPTLAGALDVK